MAEPFGWIFLDFIPLIYEKKRLARQFKIETWLNLSEAAKSLGLENIETPKTSDKSSMAYVV